MTPNFQLIQTETADNLVLTGLYSSGEKAKEAIIYVHGFMGDFYTRKFLVNISETLKENGNALILGQHRGTGISTHFFNTKTKESVTIGSFYEKFEDAHLDISAWIEFLQKEGYSKFVLMGHSLGTIKVTRYLFEGKYKDSISKLILLAPFDKNGYVEDKTKGEWHEHIKMAEQKIKDGKELEIIPNTLDDFPMTYRTYHSWYSEYELNSMFDFYRKDYDFPTLNSIKIPVQIIVGDKDEYFFIQGLNKDIAEVEEILRKSIKNLDLHILKGAGHIYLGYEELLTKQISKFLSSNF